MYMRGFEECGAYSNRNPYKKQMIVYDFRVSRFIVAIFYFSALPVIRERAE